MIFKQSQSCLDRLNLKGSAIGNIIDSYVDMKDLSKSINPPHAVVVSLLPVNVWIILFVLFISVPRSSSEPNWQLFQFT